MASSLTIASKAYSAIHIMVIIRFKSARSSYTLGGGMADHCSNIGPSHAMVVTSIPWNCVACHQHLLLWHHHLLDPQ